MYTKLHKLKTKKQHIQDGKGTITICSTNTKKKISLNNSKVIKYNKNN